METLELNILNQPPLTLAQWQNQRSVIRGILWDRLGDLPALFTPQAIVLSRTEREDCVIEKIMFDNGVGAQVHGYFLLPVQHTGRLPVVMYQHAHGNKYDIGKEELFHERMPGIFPGIELVKAGFAVLAVDAYGFGERQNQGPAGDGDSGAATEHALFKQFLWQGSTLWGMMIRDDLLALNYLVTRPEIDASRIGVVGMSLGGTRATWLAALDDRPQVIVPIAQMTRYQDFAATGRYNLHGVYYYVPGMLKTGLDMEHLVGLAAPRPQTILIGDVDPLSPIDGVQRIQAYVERIYELYGASDQFKVVIEQGIGHQFTPSMFAAMVESLKHGLGA